MASTYLSRTQSAGNRKTYTLSAWVKRSNIASQQNIFGTPSEGEAFGFNSGNQLYFFHNGSSGSYIVSNALFRDTSAWYHLVVMNDTSQATASNRVKIYVNGEQITSFSSSTYPAQDSEFKINQSGQTIYVGQGHAGSLWNGSMAHVHFIDGTAYDASAFGETDSTTGQWKPKTSPSVTYGTNGFFLKFANSGSMGTDSSGNGNNFTVAAGTLTQTQDTPSNVFCTLNSNILTPDSSWANTNLRFNGPSSHKSTWGTFGFSSGKWYWEAKATSSGTDKHTVGLDDMRNQSNHAMTSGTNLIVGYTPSAGYANGDGISWYYDTLRKNGSVIASSLSAIVNNDIMMVAVDADNGKIYFGKNGTWRVANSSTFDSAQHDTTFTIGETYCPAFAAESCSWLCNFGDGYFGTTAVSSANSDDAGLGLFEYAPPTGYYSLCTKNINTYG